MTIRHKGTPGPFTILVANFTGQKDKKGNPVKARTGFSPAVVFSEDNLNHNNGVSSDLPSPSTATITVSSAVFIDGPAILFIGKYTLISGEDWLPVEGNTSASASNLAQVINSLPGFSATALGSDITVEGPAGIAGAEVALEAEYNGSVVNFTLVPDNGFFSPGEPHLSGMGIIK